MRELAWLASDHALARPDRGRPGQLAAVIQQQMRRDGSKLLAADLLTLQKHSTL